MLRQQTCGSDITEKCILSPVLPCDLELEIELADAILGVAAVTPPHEQPCFFSVRLCLLQEPFDDWFRLVRDANAADGAGAGSTRKQTAGKRRGELGTGVGGRLSPSTAAPENQGNTI